MLHLTLDRATTVMKPIAFHFSQNELLAGELTTRIGAEPGVMEWHRFPDRESLITLHGDCSKRDVIFICSLNDPDSKALPLRFCAATARDLGARRIGLVAPYLGYMRQDRRFREGQARSAYEFARFLSASFDWVISVDPHLHRLSSLGEIFSVPAVSVSAMPAVSDWIHRNVERPVLIGPDRGSAQWTERIARSLDVPWLVLDKVRSGDDQVTVSAVDPTLLRGGNPVIVDDIASSGRTLVEVLGGLEPMVRQNAACVIVHALFSEEAERALREAGARLLVSTNTVVHPTNRIDIVPLLCNALEQFVSH
jgi:ribose-phosphate pyrophosphokinase